MAEKAMLPVYQFLQDTVSALLYEYNLGFRADASFSLAAFSECFPMILVELDEQSLTRYYQLWLHMISCSHSRGDQFCMA